MNHINTVNEFIEFADSYLQNDVDSMFAKQLVSYRNDVVQGIESQNRIKWLNKVLTDSERIGSMVDYTSYDIGDEVDGEIVRRCPVCGRPGLVQDDPKYFFYTVHVLYVHGSLINTWLDSCEWGEEAVKFRGSQSADPIDGIRCIQSPAMHAHSVSFYSHRENFGL